MAHPQATCNSASAHARRSGGSPGYSRCPTRPRWSSSQRNCPQNSRSRPSGGWHIRTRSACKVRAAIACMPPSQHAHNCDHHAHAHMPRACSPMCMYMDMDMSMHMLHQHAHAQACAHTHTHTSIACACACACRMRPKRLSMQSRHISMQRTIGIHHYEGLRGSSHDRLRRVTRPHRSSSMWLR
jgi:hypothetical protein